MEDRNGRIDRQV